MALADRLSEIENALGGRGQDLQNALAENTRGLRELLDTRAPGLIATLSQRGGEIAEEMTNVGDLVTQTIESRGMAIVQHLAAKQAELTDAMERSAAYLREALESGAAESIGALIDANGKLGAEMTEVIDRLVNGSVSMQDAISAAGANFIAVEDSMGRRIDEFRTLLANVSAEVDRLSQTAGETVHDASVIAEAIAGHRERLAASASDLVRSQNELDQTLDARRASLDALLASIGERRDEFEGAMASFTAAIDSALHNAEARAREVGAFVADASQSAGDAVDRQFADIRAKVTEERDRTTQAMRAAYEGANAEIDRVFGQTSQRFQAAASDLREMSREIQNELVVTREALQTSVADLPQETAQQAAAMRKIVADEIKALKELTEMVTRSGRSLDVSTPLPTPERAPPAPARPAQPPRPAEPQRTSAPSQPSEPRQPPAQPAPERGGWLSNLLARASSDEPPEPARTARDIRTKGAAPTSALDALSLDIASMIDANAAAEAWERYRRGESNAFSHGIYVGRGVQAFEDIRRRYRLNPEFHATVDRYVQEFERLISELNPDGADESVTRTYLNSETGMVYTMLAHASGRLSRLGG